MTQKEAIELILVQHKRILFVEFRSSRVETINWRDKSTGRALTATMVKHVVESGDDSVVITERVPEGEKPTDHIFQEKKGTICALHVESLIVDKGSITGRGKLERFDQSK